MKPIHKFNNGNGATLCHKCSKIINIGFTKDLYCSDKCKENHNGNKAKDLVNTFYYSLPNNGSTEGLNSTTRRYAEAKQCALIAVDELIKQVNHSDVGYWQEVKQEIEKL